MQVLRSEMVPSEVPALLLTSWVNLRKLPDLSEPLL